MTPRRLSPENLHPELRRTFRWVPNPPIRRGWQRALARSAIRFLPAPELPGDMTLRSVEVPEGAGAHVFTPAGGGCGGALLWIHGGGMVIGASAQDHSRLAALAHRLDVVVVSVEYRLAPEHPYPEPLDDCHAAWAWTTAHTQELGIDPDRIAVGGQSAGGGLAAGLALRSRDEGGPQPAAQWLFCPMLDDRTAADRRLDGVRHFLWNNRSNLIGWTAYLGGAPGRAGLSPYAAPARREDLSGLPPTWIGVGGIDLFAEESRRYAAALTNAGVDCTLDVVPGAPHAFESVATTTRTAQSYLERAEHWLAARLAGPSVPTPDA